MKAFSLYFCGLIITMTCCGREAEPSLPKPYSCSTQSGDFSIESTLLGQSGADIGVTVKVKLKGEEQQVKIADEAHALEGFFEAIKKQGIEASRISSLYYPSTKESEVLVRVAAATSTSETWRNRVQGDSNALLADLIVKCGAYSEVLEVLKKNQLHVSSLAVEKIFLAAHLSSKGKSATKVPSTWTTFFTLRPLDEKAHDPPAK